MGDPQRPADPARASAGPHLPADFVHQAASSGAGDLRREQAARLALSEAGDSLSAGVRDDAGEHLSEAGAEVPGVSEMPSIRERQNALSPGSPHLIQGFKFAFRFCGS